MFKAAAGSPPFPKNYHHKSIYSKKEKNYKGIGKAGRQEGRKAGRQEGRKAGRQEGGGREKLLTLVVIVTPPEPLP